MTPRFGTGYSSMVIREQNRKREKSFYENEPHHHHHTHHSSQITPITSNHTYYYLLMTRSWDEEPGLTFWHEFVLRYLYCLSDPRPSNAGGQVGGLNVHRSINEPEPQSTIIRITYSTTYHVLRMRQQLEVYRQHATVQTTT